MSSTPAITLCNPSRYASESNAKTPTTPHAEFFYRTWSVAHSTLSMWKSAKNVRITYKPIEDGTSFDDLVEYEKGAKLKNVKGIDTTLGPGSYIWRGKGLLKPFTSHWEVLGWGWGEHMPDGDAERWMVIWFAKTLFTEEGIDILTDRKEGLSEKTLSDLKTQLKSMQGCDKMVALVEKKLIPVKVELPWISNDS
ncbi:hypothetical protein PFICI_09237 [Pestalotiopsis fici W106-1]|uniref:Uncharacterized protein n=1 Tax=Pestalotiopsis fici (strain W106-1 / CGMCC3.15140) TaxID=1229662 RepID=W3X038_PESFW|nr:uncharacterized protein PFICI_09237 [Pestalotiopsis fici W106-1]ETS79384.1 hypothetical protein PFICI_09237 [Pestalotiopsis fici W106-1]